MIEPLLISTEGFLGVLGRTTLSIATYGYLGGVLDPTGGYAPKKRTDDEEIIDILTMLLSCKII